MYTNTSRNDFIDTFVAIGRADIGDGNGGNFTIEALHALFNYLEEWEGDIGEPVEFDPIGLCCQFSEYESASDAVSEINGAEYSDIVDANAYEDEQDLNAQTMDIEAECLEWLQNKTIVIGFPGGLIIDSEF